MWFYFQFYSNIFLLKHYQSFHYVFFKYIQNKYEYMIENMIHQAIYYCCMNFLCFSMYKKILKYDKAILFLPLLKSNLSVSLSIKTWALRSFTISWVHKYSIHFLYYTFICIDLIMLLYTFLVISSDWYKK